MSTRKPDLTHPLLMGAVVVGLALVIVVNVRTFGGRKSPQPPRTFSGLTRGTEGRDALVFLAEALESGTLAYADVDDAPSRFVWPGNLRDPFAEAPAGADAPAASTATQDPDAGGGLRCEAVLLRGKDPVALIGGRPCRVGDTVDGALVCTIDRGGVELERDGRRVRLAVMANADDASAEWIVMGDGAESAAMEANDDDGGTR